MSQVTMGGGDSVTSGLLPMLTSFMGAAAPHCAPSRIGASGTATTARPFSNTAQRACACSISCCDQGSIAAGLAPGLGSTFGHCADLAGVGDGATAAGGAAGEGAGLWAKAADPATRQPTAAVAKHLIHIEDLPLVSARGPGT